MEMQSLYLNLDLDADNNNNNDRDPIKLPSESVSHSKRKELTYTTTFPEPDLSLDGTDTDSTDDNINHHRLSPLGKKTPYFLPSSAIQIRKTWYEVNPYPSKNRHQIEARTGLTRAQISSWFYRTRYPDRARKRNQPSQGRTPTETQNPHRHPPSTLKILRAWYCTLGNNEGVPRSPSLRERAEIAEQTGLTTKQVTTWIYNARYHGKGVRIKEEVEEEEKASQLNHDQARDQAQDASQGTLNCTTLIDKAGAHTLTPAEELAGGLVGRPNSAGVHVHEVTAQARVRSNSAAASSYADTNQRAMPMLTDFDMLNCNPNLNDRHFPCNLNTRGSYLDINNLNVDDIDGPLIDWDFFAQFTARYTNQAADGTYAGANQINIQLAAAQSGRGDCSKH
ncbi:hypothetical protein BDW74DRAFT_172303 [Aspergillus multicolor]|uniref:homeobox domain-containing protein n=1 Tax=Aspergillus multicolor TaxID=41759 RepID=UPI003CCDFE8C